jgi:hypothetical protein
MRDGQPFITSGSSLSARELLPWHTYLLPQRGAQDSEYIYVQDRIFSSSGEYLYTNLLKLNTLNGRVSSSVKRPGDTYFWLLDNKGEPRLAMTTEKGGTNGVYYRDPATDEWRKLTDFERYTNRGGAFRPVSFGPDGTFYVVSHAPGKDTTAVFTYDIATGKMSDKPLVALDGYDFQGSMIVRDNKLLGVNHLTDAWGTSWIDPGMKALQEKIDKMLPNTVNQLALPSRPETPWVMVTSFADIWPRRTLLYNTETDKLTLIGAAYSAIDPNQMARKDLVHYKARDGLNIPAWLTLPKGSGKNLPLVVLVHGGPWVRGGQWDWDPQAQFLASRGYAVL